MNTKPERGSEIDNHADTCVVGANALITHDYQRPVSVTGFDPSNRSQHLKIVSAALAYDDHRNGKPVILVINQAIHVPTIEHNLLSPMQMRLNGIAVSECPKFLHPTPTDRTHAITIRRDDDDDYIIPMQLKGVTSYFPTRKPTLQELEEADLQFDLTADQPSWNPHSDEHQVLEDSFIHPDGGLRDSQISKRLYFIRNSLQ